MLQHTAGGTHETPRLVKLKKKNPLTLAALALVAGYAANGGAAASPRRSADGGSPLLRNLPFKMLHNFLLSDVFG